MVDLATQKTTAVRIGPIELSVEEKKSVDIPLWAGIGAIVAGGGVLPASRKWPKDSQP